MASLFDLHKEHRQMWMTKGHSSYPVNIYSSRLANADIEGSSECFVKNSISLFISSSASTEDELDLFIFLLSYTDVKSHRQSVQECMNFGNYDDSMITIMNNMIKRRSGWRKGLEDNRIALRLTAFLFCNYCSKNPFQAINWVWQKFSLTILLCHGDDHHFS